jgi:hypothetical protein
MSWMLPHIASAHAGYDCSLRFHSLPGVEFSPHPNHFWFSEIASIPEIKNIPLSFSPKSAA